MTEAAPEPDDLLPRLVMRRLMSVDFHLDRLELHFDGDSDDDRPVLTCEVWPEVRQPGVTLRQEGFGYADALRALVGQLVMGTTEAAGEGIVLELQGASLVLDPAPGGADRAGDRSAERVRRRPVDGVAPRRGHLRPARLRPDLRRGGSGPVRAPSRGRRPRRPG